MSTFSNIEIGTKFGKLTVTGTHEMPRPGRKTGKLTRYIVRCECGQERKVRKDALLKGTSTSCGCSRRLPHGQSIKNSLYSQYQRNAQRREHQWSLEKGLFNKLVTGNCHYCGAPPSSVFRVSSLVGQAFAYNGVDRKDSSLGYTKSNAVTCCAVCNRAKRDMSYETFLSYILRIRSIG